MSNIIRSLRKYGQLHRGADDIMQEASQRVRRGKKFSSDLRDESTPLVTSMIRISTTSMTVPGMRQE
jgi:hypothetical protein